MANVAKVITIIGSSPESFAKAADAAVQEAAKCLAENAMPPLHWIQLLRFLP